MTTHSERRSTWVGRNPTFDANRNYVGARAPEEISDYAGEFIRDLLRETGINQDREVDFIYDGQEQDNGKDGVVEECDPSFPITVRMIEIRNEFLGQRNSPADNADTLDSIRNQWDLIFNAFYSDTIQKLSTNSRKADFADEQLALSSAANRAFNQVFHDWFTKPITDKLESEGEWNPLTQQWLPRHA